MYWQSSILKFNKNECYIQYIWRRIMTLHAFQSKERVIDALRRANIATLHTASFYSFTTNHIKWILLTFTYFSPPRAILILINTVSTIHLLDWFLKVTDVNPLGCRPLLALNDWTASMQALSICTCIQMETEEQQGITLLRLYWNDRNRRKG